MADTENMQIVLTAIQSVGPVGDDRAEWEARVMEQIANVTVMATSDRSDFVRQAESMKSAKTFVGHVVGVRKEASSTRGIVTLFTATDRAKDGIPAGCEEARTERTDNAFGLHTARRLRELIGHKVLVWVEVETYGNGAGKVRVVRHVQDLGLSEEPLAVEALQRRQQAA